LQHQDDGMVDLERDSNATPSKVRGWLKYLTENVLVFHTFLDGDRSRLQGPTLSFVGEIKTERLARGQGSRTQFKRKDCDLYMRTWRVSQYVVTVPAHLGPAGIS
jgi:hypothetical protein